MQYFVRKGVGSDLAFRYLMQILGAAVELWTLKASCAGKERQHSFSPSSLHKSGCENNGLDDVQIVANI